MVVAVIIVVIGYCLIFGAHGLAERLLRAAFGFVLVMSFLPGIVARCERGLRHLHGGRPRPDGPWGAVTILAVLTLVGLLAWKTRGIAKHLRESWRRKHFHPRRRAPQLPPSGSEDRP
jgi:hypothetical protein